MNRRERKALEKRLGLHKHKKNMTRQARFENMRENILEGKKKQEEMREVRRLQEEGQEVEIQSSNIATLATDLMVKEDLSYIDALEKAKEILAEKEEKE
jgi:hypothetical protein